MEYDNLSVEQIDEILSYVMKRMKSLDRKPYWDSRAIEERNELNHAKTKLIAARKSKMPPQPDPNEVIKVFLEIMDGERDADDWPF
jgi:hypothetical protein